MTVSYCDGCNLPAPVLVTVAEDTFKVCAECYTGEPETEFVAPEPEEIPDHLILADEDDIEYSTDSYYEDLWESYEDYYDPEDYFW